MKKLFITVMAVLLALTAVSCRWDIWGSEPIDYGQGLRIPHAKMPFKGDRPKHVNASKAVSPSKITLTWDDVPGAEYYIVERATVETLEGLDYSTLKWDKMLVENAIPYYEDSVLSSDETIENEADKYLSSRMKYLYRVRGMSYSNATRYGEWSDPVAGWLISVPSGFSASQGDFLDNIMLSWKPVDGIVGYRIEWNVGLETGGWRSCTEKNQLIPPSSSEEDCVFSFKIPKKLSGRNINFRIQAVKTTGTDGIRSEWSEPVVGYTKSEGAPGMPEDFKVSKAQSQKEISISWVDPKDPVLQWEIYRKSSREPERRLLSTIEEDNTIEISGDRMVYVDSDGLVPGVEYTYSVRALSQNSDGEWITGTPTDPQDGVGFLYGPPTKISGIRIEEKDGMKGFAFKFKKALGEAPEWSYSVFGRETPDNQWKAIENFGLIQADPVAEEYEVFIPYGTYGDVDLHYEEFTIKSNNGLSMTDESSATATGKVISVPSPLEPTGFNASDNQVYDLKQTRMDKVGDPASPDEVYGISVTFEEQKDIVSYDLKIERNGETKSEPDLTDIVPSDLEGSAGTKIIRNICSTGVGEKVKISIRGKDRLGRVGEWSKPNEGYSAISDSTLIKYMQMFCLKPWEYMGHPLMKGYKEKYVDSGAWGYQGSPSDADLPAKWQRSSIRGKIAQNGTGSLSGGITEFSNVFDKHPAGSIKYVATVQGLGGRISFNYSKFGEVPFMTTDGFFVMVVSMSGDGSCDGGITVKGWYPASVGFDNISVGGQAFVGTYSVKQDNGTAGSAVSPVQK